LRFLNNERDGSENELLLRSRFSDSNSDMNNRLFFMNRFLSSHKNESLTPFTLRHLTMKVKTLLLSDEKNHQVLKMHS
jgi:hypothetical protein